MNTFIIDGNIYFLINAFPICRWKTLCVYLLSEAPRGGGGGAEGGARETAPGPRRLQSEVKATESSRLIDD